MIVIYSSHGMITTIIYNLLIMEGKQILGIEENLFANALKVVGGLYKEKRTGWVRRGVKNPETVGEHIDALIVLAKRVCAIRKELNQQKLERMLQIHDWPEYKTGDIVTFTHDPEKRERMLKDKKYKEEVAMDSICEKLGLEGVQILELWKEYEGGKHPKHKSQSSWINCKRCYKLGSL